MFYFLLFFADLFAAASAFAPGPNGAGGEIGRASGRERVYDRV
jgi:hypothetical protein